MARWRRPWPPLWRFLNEDVQRIYFQELRQLRVFNGAALPDQVRGFWVNGWQLPEQVNQAVKKHEKGLGGEMRILTGLACVLLAACASERGAPTADYTVRGTDAFVTLSDGSFLVMPCMITTSRVASRIEKKLDDCELSYEQQQFIFRREEEIKARQGK